ncbi:MAG: IS1182 family transposase [Candidatus Binatia bacterium]
MGQIFHPYTPEQTLLLPPSVADWVPAGHLAHFVSDSVDQLDLTAWYARYEQREDGRGQLAYEPRLMVKLLIYAYAVGIFSSRKIAQALDDLVPLRSLAAGNRPSHRTLARFREEHCAQFQALFVQVVRIARAAGLVTMGTLAIDGSKVQANASKHKAMSYGRMQEADAKLHREIAAITARARGVDAAEDVEFGPDFRGDELPAELQRRDTRRAKIREAMQRLEAEQAAADTASGRGTGRTKKMKRPNGTPPANAQMNFTDPESRVMKTGRGHFEQCYNAQVAVDAAQQIIVAAAVTTNAADVGQLIPVVDQAEANTGQRPATVLADAGYKSEANFAAVEARDIEAYVSLGKGEEQRPGAEAPSGPCTQRMGAKLRTDEGRRRFKRRKAIVEPPLGWIKHVLGFRTFSMRGHRKTAGEWSLVCLVMNLRRMRRALAHA